VNRAADASAAAPGAALWLVCLLAFTGLLAVALVAIFLPAARRKTAAKRARLDEISRYRVLGVTDPRSEGADAAAADPVGALRPLVDRVLGLAGRHVDRGGRRPELAERLERAGLRMRPEEWSALVLFVAVAAACLGAFALGIVGCIAGAALGWLGCRIFRQVRTSRRCRAFEAQLADALHLLASSLRAGLALNSAIATLVREGLEPVSSEFGRAVHEVRLGTTLEDALDGIVRRTDSADMALVVVALRTAREVGGNLAEVLQTTAATMRERAEVRGQIRTLSAEGRFSAKVLVALPLLMGAYLLAFKRTYLAPLYTTGTGILLLVAGGVLLVLGSVWLSRLTKIEV
jgi:Flp pilus assembly protein TadB